MDAGTLKLLATILSGMSATEAISLVGIIAMMMVAVVKATVKFMEFIATKKTDSAATNAKPSREKTDTGHEQVLIQLTIIREKLSQIESTQKSGVNNKFEMPKELANELSHLFKKIDDHRNEQDDAKRDILKMLASVEEVLSVIKEKLQLIETQLPTLKTDNKDSIRDVDKAVQQLSRDISTLQGTIIGNMGSRGRG